MRLRPSPKDEKFGVQRIEMLAIYFAIAENQLTISKLANSYKKRELVVYIRSDSKTCIDQLQGISQIRDAILQRISSVIKDLLQRVPSLIIFNYLERARNIAGLLLERKKRKEEEKLLMYKSDQYRGIKGIQELWVPRIYGNWKPVYHYPSINILSELQLLSS